MQEKLVGTNYYLNKSAKEAYRSYILGYNSHTMKDTFNVHRLDLQVHFLLMLLAFNQLSSSKKIYSSGVIENFILGLEYFSRLFSTNSVTELVIFCAVLYFFNPPEISRLGLKTISLDFCSEAFLFARYFFSMFFFLLIYLFIYFKLGLICVNGWLN